MRIFSRNCYISVISLLLAAALFGPSAAQGITDDNDEKFCIAKYPFCKGGSELSHVPQDDTLDVVYLEAPVFKELFGPITGLFKMLHTGIGFYSRKTGQEFTIEYDAKFEVANATFPFVIGKTLKWCNAGAFCSYPFVNEDYWSFNQTAIGSINGKQFNALLDWVQSVNTTNEYSHYELWDVYSSHWKNPPENQDSHLINSLTCASGAFRLLGKLKGLGAQLVSSLHRDYIVLYARNLEEINQEDPSERTALLEYYSDFQVIGKKFREIVHMLEHFLVHDKFIYANGKYYKMNMRWPFFGFHYAETPIIAIE